MNKMDEDLARELELGIIDYIRNSLESPVDALTILFSVSFSLMHAMQLTPERVKNILDGLHKNYEASNE